MPATLRVSFDETKGEELISRIQYWGMRLSPRLTAFIISTPLARVRGVVSVNLEQPSKWLTRTNKPLTEMRMRESVEAASRRGFRHCNPLIASAILACRETIHLPDSLLIVLPQTYTTHDDYLVMCIDGVHATLEIEKPDRYIPTRYHFAFVHQ